MSFKLNKMVPGLLFFFFFCIALLTIFSINLFNKYCMKQTFCTLSHRYNLPTWLISFSITNLIPLGYISSLLLKMMQSLLFIIHTIPELKREKILGKRLENPGTNLKKQIPKDKWHNETKVIQIQKLIHTEQYTPAHFSSHNRYRKQATSSCPWHPVKCYWCMQSSQLSLSLNCENSELRSRTITSFPFYFSQNVIPVTSV